VARDNSHVEAWGSSHVEAWGSSHVEALDNSHVEAWGSSHVEAWGSVCVQIQSDFCSVVLFAFAVGIALAKAEIKKKSDTATIVRPERREGVAGWLEDHAIAVEADRVLLYKRVSSDFLTQQGKAWEQRWDPGSTVEHSAWEPESSECGPCKFHACARPYFADEFCDGMNDRYVAVEIAVADLYAWPNPSYPHKIAFRAGRVLYECDLYATRIDR
jgi:hypothetical protein